MSNQIKHKLRILLFTLFSISIISISGFAAYAMQPVSIPTEVKEPFEILNYPSSFSLYPGETIDFNFTVENAALVNYFQEFEFLVDDTDYQRYVTFSNHNYSIPPGIQSLNAWFTIASNAPSANFTITVNKKTENLNSTPTPTTPPKINTTLTGTLELLAGGIKWAAQEGNSALYINWLDNYKDHHATDGVDWEYWMSKETLEQNKFSTLVTLESKGFKVTTTGDFPVDLSTYDVVVIYAYYAIEPRHSSLIREYVQNGGNVVLLSGSPTYFTIYSKCSKSGYDLDPIDDWFGASRYSNDGGTVRVAFDNPFDTSLLTIDKAYFSGSSEAAISSLSSNAKPIAYWDSGKVFAFTHEYGAGRVYYQAQINLIENY